MWEKRYLLIHLYDLLYISLKILNGYNLYGSYIVDLIVFNETFSFEDNLSNF